MLHNMPCLNSVINQVVQLGNLRYYACMQAELKDQRVPVMMSVSELKKLDAWRRAEDDLPSRGEAIRRLIELGLAAKLDSAPQAQRKRKPTAGSRHQFTRS
jgi:hypothetical protein